MRYRIKKISKTNGLYKTDFGYIIQKRFMFLFWVNASVDYVSVNEKGEALYLSRIYLHQDLQTAKEVFDDLKNPVSIKYNGHTIKRMRNDYHMGVKYYYPITSIWNYNYGFLHYPHTFKTIEKAKHFIDEKLISKTKIEIIN